MNRKSNGAALEAAVCGLSVVVNTAFVIGDCIDRVAPYTISAWLHLDHWFFGHRSGDSFTVWSAQQAAFSAG